MGSIYEALPSHTRPLPVGYGQEWTDTILGIVYPFVDKPRKLILEEADRKVRAKKRLANGDPTNERWDIYFDAFRQARIDPNTVLNIVRFGGRGYEIEIKNLPKWAGRVLGIIAIVMATNSALPLNEIHPILPYAVSFAEAVALFVTSIVKDSIVEGKHHNKRTIREPVTNIDQELFLGYVAEEAIEGNNVNVSQVVNTIASDVLSEQSPQIGGNNLFNSTPLRLVFAHALSSPETLLYALARYLPNNPQVLDAIGKLKGDNGSHYQYLGNEADKIREHAKYKSSSKNEPYNVVESIGKLLEDMGLPYILNRAIANNALNSLNINPDTRSNLRKATNKLLEIGSSDKNKGSNLDMLLLASMVPQGETMVIKALEEKTISLFRIPKGAYDDDEATSQVTYLIDDIEKTIIEGAGDKARETYTNYVNKLIGKIKQTSIYSKHQPLPPPVMKLIEELQKLEHKHKDKLQIRPAERFIYNLYERLAEKLIIQSQTEKPTKESIVEIESVFNALWGSLQKRGGHIIDQNELKRLERYMDRLEKRKQDIIEKEARRTEYRKLTGMAELVKLKTLIESIVKKVLPCPELYSNSISELTMVSRIHAQTIVEPIKEDSGIAREANLTSLISNIIKTFGKEIDLIDKVLSPEPIEHKVMNEKAQYETLRLETLRSQLEYILVRSNTRVKDNVRTSNPNIVIIAPQINRDNNPNYF